ncbi:MAG: Polysacc synt protein [Patescibacteria group bacterium]|nr:Polysacc synt protein [Patescibacteria group bacterium]MDQ5970585.1 Polysacc synt protein [Patescibacteria group bacterium]
MTNAQKITSNTSWYLLALIVQKLLSFGYFTILARFLGPESYGQYQLAINFAMMLSVIADLGLSAVLIRETARQVIDQDKLFRQLFSLKIILSILTAVTIIIGDILLYANNPVRPLIYLTALIVIIDSFTLLFYGFIRGQQNLRYESIGTIIFQVIILVFGLLLMQFSQSILYFILVVLAASFFNFLYSFILLHKKYNLKLTWYFDKQLIKNILLIAWPFALSALFAKVYAYVDGLILENIHGAASLGIYSVAYKVTFAFQFIPLAFVAALYPAFAHYWQNDKTQLEKTLFKSINYLAYIALPIAMGIGTLAPFIIKSLYTSNYSGSAAPLQILIASLPFLFINFALSYFLNATDRQRTNTLNLALVMILNIVLNIVLIPQWQAQGAAAASTISTVALFCLNLAAVYRVTAIKLGNWWPIAKATAAALLMATVVWYSSDFLNIWLDIILGFAVYFILLFIFKNIGRADYLYLKASLKKS